MKTTTKYRNKRNQSEKKRGKGPDAIVTTPSERHRSKNLLLLSQPQ